VLLDPGGYACDETDVLQCRSRRARLWACISGAVAVAPIVHIAIGGGCAPAIAPATSTTAALPSSCYRARGAPAASSPQPGVSLSGPGEADATLSQARDHRGSLDKEVIRAEIRRHEDEARSCYERGLTRNRLLTGRVSILFKIGPNGEVVTSEIQSSTMNDNDVEECLGRSFCSWHFSNPTGGGVVIVSYPYNFAPDR
jgi:outer membrane biosynthesis protein TonB